VTPARFGSGGPWEARYGYSRVVATDRHAWVAGCTATVDGELVHLDDARAQTLTAFGIALDALAGAGFAPSDVVRTRMYVVRPEDLDAVGLAHGEVFAAVRPASTALVVAGLVDPRMLVEVEVEAYRDGSP
jgi:enamine deaminase RidA (YjgF/YER057c/UK114 family)